VLHAQERADDEQVVPGADEHGSDVEELRIEGDTDPVGQRVDGLDVGLSEDRADRNSDHLRVGPGCPRSRWICPVAGRMCQGQ